MNDAAHEFGTATSRDEGVKKPSGGRSLGWHLAALVIGLVVPTLVFVGVLLWQYAASERARVEDQVQGEARRLAAAIDREVVGVTTTLEALVTAPSLRNGDLGAFHEQAKEVQRRQGFHVGLRNQEGVTLLSTRLPFGERITSNPAAILETDRAAMQTGDWSVSDIFVGPVNGFPTLQMVVPAEVNGQPHALGASIDPDFIRQALARSDLPDGWLAAVVDRRGQFVARSQRHADVVGKPASETFRTRAQDARGFYAGPTSDAVPSLVAYDTSPASGWRVAVSIPASVAGAALNRSLLLLVGLGLALGATAMGLAYAVRGRIVTAMRRMRDAAGSIGRGEVLPPVSTSIREMNEVGEALSGASIDLRERERARNEAEAALRLSEERLRLVVEGAKDHAIFTTDPQGTITSWSAGAQAIFGWTAAEAVGQPTAITFTPEDRAANADGRELATAAREGCANDERWHLRRDGGRVFMNGSAQPLRDGQGREVGFLKIARDETERRRTGEALAESEARLRLGAEVAGFGSYEWTFEGDEHRWTPEVYRIFGLQPDERITRDRLVALTHPDDRERIAANLAALRSGFGSGAREYRIVRHGGEVRWVQTRVRLLPDGEGEERRATGLVGAIQDITDRKQAEEALRDLNATLERRVAERTAERDRTWRLSQDLLVVAEADGTLAAVNGRWTALLGWEERELVGVSFVDLTHPDDLDETLRAFAGIMEAPLTTPYEFRLRHKDGTYRWFGWTAAFEGGRVFANGRHVTAEREGREALARAEEQLRQAQKMEAVGQLTGGIAHDFNNMLAVVIGSLDLLGRRIGADDARAKRYVDAATDGARRAALLTQRLLAFSRQQPLRPEAIDVNKLVTGMSDLIRGSLGSDIRFETVLAGGGWRTHADPNQLENVLLNLAVNARDAMPEGGRLTIETQNAHLDARYAAAHLGVAAGQYVLIAVTDTGSGMPEEVIAKAFDPFFTTKEVGRGTGLGLSQVYGFVKQSGGHVKIYSEPGEGTTVKVYLPRLIGAQGEAAEEGAPEMPLGERQEVVLVVEDEPAVRQFTVDALVELGYRVLEADGAAAALRLLDAHPEIVLLFTDVVMPDVNGRKLADEARRRRTDLKVLFTTGYTRNAVVHNGVLDPDVELIGKPFTVEELAAKMREVLDAPIAQT
jgi:PAS domain S-box-containing protein